MSQGFYGFPNILGLLRGTNLRVLGKAGATAGAGLAGGTTSGAPTSGQFDVGEAVIDQTGALWICTVTGSPGTFVPAGFANPLTTKADVLVGGAAGVASRLGVGSDNQVLTADSSQTLGLKWAVTAANAGGALTQIAQTQLSGSAASITFSGIAGTYSALWLHLLARADTSSAANVLKMQLNADTGSTYDWFEMQAWKNVSIGSLGSNEGIGSTAITFGVASDTGASDNANAFSCYELLLPGYAGATWKAVTSKGTWVQSQATSSIITTQCAASWRSTAAITSVKVFPAAGNLVSGCVATLYGVS